jgi:hypothetical protein
MIIDRLGGNFLGLLRVEFYIRREDLFDLHLLVDVLLLWPLLPGHRHGEDILRLVEVVAVLVLEKDVLLDILI